MIEFTIEKNLIGPSLLIMAGAVDKKQSLPVLANIYFNLEPNSLTMVATDLELEIKVHLSCSTSASIVTTLPAKKLIDIVRSLDDGCAIKFTFSENIATLSSGRSRFRLGTLPPDQFPVVDLPNDINSFNIEKQTLQRLLDTTYFAMSQQDVRLYLNGMLMEVSGTSLHCVATDGHRMAIAKAELSQSCEDTRFILPRKGVLELLRLLSVIEDNEIRISINDNNFSIQSQGYSFVSRLIESRFPVYQRVVPRSLHTFVLVDRDVFKRALNRITILAHEKTKAIILDIASDKLSLIGSNQQHEEASEVVEAQIDGANLKLKINAVYLLEVLQHLPEGLVRISCSDADSSVLVETLEYDLYQYIIMPIKL